MLFFVVSKFYYHPGNLIGSKIALIELPPLVAFLGFLGIFGLFIATTKHVGEPSGHWEVSDGVELGQFSRGLGLDQILSGLELFGILNVSHTGDEVLLPPGPGKSARVLVGHGSLVLGLVTTCPRLAAVAFELWQRDIKGVAHRGQLRGCLLLRDELSGLLHINILDTGPRNKGPVQGLDGAVHELTGGWDGGHAKATTAFPINDRVYNLTE